MKSYAICRFSGCIRFEKKLHPYRDRKQVTPLDLQKFLPKYSENQKWAAPLCLKNFTRQFFKQKRKAHFSSSVNAVDSKPPRLPLGGNSARKARNRKQVAPLDFQKFLPKYSENQKWAAPLDFQKFLPEYLDNQKWAAPLITALRAELPPGGKPIKEADNFCEFFRQKKEQGEAYKRG